MQLVAERKCPVRKIKRFCGTQIHIQMVATAADPYTFKGCRDKDKVYTNLILFALLMRKCRRVV